MIRNDKRVTLGRPKELYSVFTSDCLKMITCHLCLFLLYSGCTLALVVPESTQINTGDWWQWAESMHKHQDWSSLWWTADVRGTTHPPTTPTLRHGGCSSPRDNTHPPSVSAMHDPQHTCMEGGSASQAGTDHVIVCHDNMTFLCQSEHV